MLGFDCMIDAHMSSPFEISRASERIHRRCVRYVEKGRENYLFLSHGHAIVVVAGDTVGKHGVDTTEKMIS